MKSVLLVSTVTPAIVAVFTVLAAAAAGLLLPPADEEGEAPAELHATRAAKAAAAAGSPSSIRSRARPRLIRRALPLRLGRESSGVMTSCRWCRETTMTSAPRQAAAFAVGGPTPDVPPRMTTR